MHYGTKCRYGKWKNDFEKVDLINNMKSKAKILFITNLYPSDEEPNRGVYIRNQAIALKKNGYDICVLLMDYRSIRRKRKLGIYWRKQENFWICNFSIPISPFISLQYALAGQLTEAGIKEVEKKFGKIDLVHGHFLEGSYGLIYVKSKYNIPVVFTEHGSNLLDQNRNATENNRMRRLYAAVDEMIVVGHKQYECAKDFTIHSLNIIPNVIPEYFKYVVRKDKDGKNFTFISVGNLIESKCFGLLIDALEDLHNEVMNIKLIIVGSGPLEDILKRKVLERKLSNVISFRGAMNNRDLADLYNLADCFVLPSRFETFGVVYAEALCSGLPIISTRNGGIEDIYEDGCGYLVENDNKFALKDAMKCVISDKFNHQIISDRFRYKFGEKNFLEKIENVYKRVLKEPIY